MSPSPTLYDSYTETPGNKNNEQGNMLGQILVGRGQLNEEQVLDILREQPQSSLSFGELAIKKKMLTEEDVNSALASQFNYTILSPDTNHMSSELHVAFFPSSSEAEAFRALRSQLIMNGYEKGYRALAVVASQSKSGVSYTTANLAVAIAQLGLHVCLVDTNMRLPRIGNIFNIPGNAPGLSDVLRGSCDLEDVIRYDCFPRLGVIAAGRFAPNPQELLGQKQFVLTISQLLRQFDMVICDTPAMNRYADGRIIANRLGSALLVARKHNTHTKDIEAITAELKENETQLIGAVLNEY